MFRGKMLSDIMHNINDSLRKELEGFSFILTIEHDYGVCDCTNSPPVHHMTLLMMSLRGILEGMLDEKPARHGLEQSDIEQCIMGYKEELIALKNLLDITVQAGIKSLKNKKLNN